MKFNLVLLHKEGSPYAGCLEDVRQPLYYALQSLGHDVSVSNNQFAASATNIILGLQDRPDLDICSIPKESIIYNFEQISSGSKAMRPHYLEALKQFSVWEYSQRNISILRKEFQLNNITHVPLGYMPQMTRIDPDYPKDIDVLLYGSPNERRMQAIEALQNMGVKAVLADKVFGAERDFLIARSKIVLNVHYYTPGILEVVRIGYLLANKKMVVSELNADTEMHAGYEEACVYSPYDQIVKTVQALLSREELCKNQALKGYEIFKNKSYPEILSEVAGVAASDSTTRKCIPKKMNAGSGKDYRMDYFNVDISSKWNPDAVLDLSKPISSNVYETERFGKVFLTPGYFEQILANDMIEHVPDLVQTMSNFLELLCEGGSLHIKVPYELSLGAWQDPTHLRAFNENSWKYYTEWAWYLGWKDWRFELQEIEYELTSLGRYHHSQGAGLDEILKLPRAIDTMSVVLRKRKSNSSEKLEYDRRHHLFYCN